ncbi:MAG: hypothetical protein NTW57_06660 [Methylophilales bacterium]|nr:hypothetical protein [Methylophilales bacterium]
MTKDEALKMAIDWLDNQQLGYSGHSVRKACQEALEQPKQWQGLSDDEIDLIVVKSETLLAKDIARAIEAKLKENNNGLDVGYSL